jgi:hypothetical protein
VKENTQERIEAYLEGRLGLEDTLEFERDLLDPQVATLFAEELMLRELIASAPPDGPPVELVDSIILSMELEQETAQKEPRRQGFPRMRAVLQGMGWTVRGPAMAVSGRSGQATISGLSTMRYALGPFGSSSREKVKPAPKKKKRRWWLKILRRKK